MIDGVRYYNLEAYLFEDVHRRFHQDGFLSAFDFFSIVIWKANRAKSRIARRLLQKHPDRSLEEVVKELTGSLWRSESSRERLRVLIEEWGFLLPMASAILTVLWPKEFTVYDVRVCEQLGSHERLGDLTDFDRIWPGYEAFREEVEKRGEAGLSLRDRDRWLWGISAAEQLERDIQRRFGASARSAKAPKELT